MKYIQSVKKILTGDLEYAKFNKNNLIFSLTHNLITIDFEKLTTEEELKLRESVKQEDKYKIFSQKAKPN